MFSHLFVWCYIIYTSCLSAFQRGAQSANQVGGLGIANVYVNIGFWIDVIFLILGFFFMPHWWYPLVLFGLGTLVNAIPILDIIWVIIGWVAMPVCAVLMYLDMFGII